MGSGISTTFYDLSSEEKTVFAKALKNEYEIFRVAASESEGGNDVLLFEALKSTYDNTAEKIVQKRNQTIKTSSSCPSSPSKSAKKAESTESKNESQSDDKNQQPHAILPIEAQSSSPSSSDLVAAAIKAVGELQQDDDHDDDQEHPDNLEFSLRNSFNIGGPNSNSTPTLISKIDKGGQKLLKAKTSSQLLSMLSDSAMDDTNKVANFISQLRAGEVPTKELTDFRQRRLTYSKETAADEVATSNNKIQMHNLPKPSNTRSRTSIFASSEIGFVHAKKPPFPTDILGTYSCHGVEPCHDDFEGIHAKINQDRGCVAYPYNSNKKEALFMVLDGHGEHGDKVSEFVMRQIIVSLEKDPLLSTDPCQALKNAFITTNTALLVTDIHYMTSGCTCVAVYCKENRLYIANTGDSRAVMASLDENGRVIAIPLSRDHKPDDPDEMDRINRWGGFVRPAPEIGLSARVYLDAEHTMIGLAMSRSIGDHAVKDVGVIAEPEVQVYDIEENNLFMIMASDGVWEFINSQEAVEIVHSVIDDGVPEACQELIEQSACRWQDEEGDYRDDITAIVVRFPLPYHLCRSHVSSERISSLSERNLLASDT